MNSNKLEKNTKQQKDEWILDLINAFAMCNSLEKVVIFLQDLMTKSELKMLSRRLHIAKLLLEGYNYREIQESMHVSHATVAKVAAWLSERGEGFRETIGKLPKKKGARDPLDITEWSRLKKRYPMYFWPELLLEEIVKSANKRQKEKMLKVLNQLDKTVDEKSRLNQQIEKLLR